MVTTNSRGETEFVYRVKINDGEFSGLKTDAIRKETKYLTGEYEWVLREFKKRRSHSQNDTQWWYFTEIAKETGHTKQYIHSLLSYKFLLVEEVDEKTGEIEKRVRGTSELTTEEHNVFLENVRNWAERYLNIHLPEPDANWRLNLG